MHFCIKSRKPTDLGFSQPPAYREAQQKVQKEKRHAGDCLLVYLINTKRSIGVVKFDKITCDRMPQRYENSRNYQDPWLERGYFRPCPIERRRRKPRFAEAPEGKCSKGFPTLPTPPRPAQTFSYVIASEEIERFSRVRTIQAHRSAYLQSSGWMVPAREKAISGETICPSLRNVVEAMRLEIAYCNPIPVAVAGVVVLHTAVSVGDVNTGKLRISPAPMMDFLHWHSGSLLDRS